MMLVTVALLVRCSQQFNKAAHYGYNVLRRLRPYKYLVQYLTCRALYSVPRLLAAPRLILYSGAGLVSSLF